MSIESTFVTLTIEGRHKKATFNDVERGGGGGSGGVSCKKCFLYLCFRYLGIPKNTIQLQH